MAEENPDAKAKTENNDDKNHVVERSIVEEMKSSYIDYSMSVIVSRATA